MKIGMFSYNAFISSERSNGWKTIGDNSIFLMQDPKGRPFATTQRGQASAMIEETRNIIDNAWDAFAAEMPDLEKIIIYVGSLGAERAIELAKETGISSEKLLFVFCDCELETKMNSIKECGYEDAKIIDCECGGNNTMCSIFKRFLETGIVKQFAA